MLITAEGVYDLTCEDTLDTFDLFRLLETLQKTEIDAAEGSSDYEDMKELIGVLDDVCDSVGENVTLINEDYFADLDLLQKSLHAATIGDNPEPSRYPDARLEYEITNTDPYTIMVYENFYGWTLTEENKDLKGLYYQPFAVIEVIEPLTEVTPFFDENGFNV